MASHSINVLRIDHVVFRVSDLELSIRFFHDVLGMDVVRRRDDLGLVHLRAGTSMIDLLSGNGPQGHCGGATPADDGRNVDHVCLRIDPFDETRIRAHLALHGVAPVGEVQNNFGAEGDGPSLYIRDPDGNSIELKGASRSSGY